MDLRNQTPALVLGLMLAAAARLPSAPAALPPQLDDYVTRHVKLTPEQRFALLSGKPVTQLLDADPSTEVAVFGAVWVAAPVARYVSAMKDIETFEKGGSFRVTRKISSPPRIEDFAQIALSDEDVKSLRSCNVGDCEIKWGSPRSTGSAAGGLGETLGPCRRRSVDAKTVARVRQRLSRRRQLPTGRLPRLGSPDVCRQGARVDDRPHAVDLQYLPDVKRYLLGFPGVTLPGATSFLYWQEARSGSSRRSGSTTSSSPSSRRTWSSRRR